MVEKEAHSVKGEAYSMNNDFLNVFRGEKPKWPVWTADISYWMSGRREDGTADPAWATEDGYLLLHHELGIVPYYDYAHFWAGWPVYEPTVTLHTETKGHRSRSTIRTPRGELESETTYLPESACGATTRPYVQNAGGSGPAALHSGTLPTRAGQSGRLRNPPGRLGALWRLLVACPARSPLPAFCYEWAGLENAIMLLMDQEDKVRRIFSLIEAQQEPILDAVCRLAPPVVHFADNLSSDNFTSLYDEFMAPLHRHRLKKTPCRRRESRRPSGRHHPRSAPQTGSRWIRFRGGAHAQAGWGRGLEEMRAVAGSDRLILWGGVPGAMFAPPYTWADMQAHMERLLTSWGGTPFIIGVADQIPPDGDISFCKKIAAMIKEV